MRGGKWLGIAVFFVTLFLGIFIVVQFYICFFRKAVCKLVR